MNSFGHHFTAAIVAAVVAGLTAGAVIKYGPEPKPRIVTVVSTGASPTSIARTVASQWPEIEQREVDALTAALKTVAVSDRRPVVIFCQDDLKCGDLGLNLENSFESAHWTVTRETPLADATTGIGVSDPKMLDMIARSTSLKPTMITANMKDAIAVVIGRKPKG